MKNIIRSTIILIILLSIYIKRPYVITNIINGIELWKNNLFPSIFPILIISDFIMSTNIINVISNIIGPIFTKIFKTSNCSSYVFLMSIFSGTPTNAKYILDLYNNHSISKKEVEKLLSMTQLYNPILIITITPFLELKTSLFLIISNVLINIIIGIINRNYKVKISNTKLTLKKFDLVESINKSINILLLILGSVITFITINSLIPIKSPLISGIFEITTGINMINNFDYLYKYKVIFTAILLSFGGFSILLQIKSIFKDTNLDYSLYYKSRIIHLIFFIIISFVYCCLL